MPASRWTPLHTWESRWAPPGASAEGRPSWAGSAGSVSTPDPGAHPHGAGPRPVFVDPTGRRGRGVQILAVVSGALLLVVIALFTLSLIAVPSLPHLRGIGPEVRRAVRPRLPAR